METQTTQTKRKPVGRSRIKARNLSHMLRQSIVDQFIVHESTEDVAEQLRLPVRTVDDVIKLHTISRTRPVGPVLIGRAA